MRREKKKLNSYIVLVAVFLLGLSIMLYPTVSDYVNSIHASHAIASYSDTVDNMSEEDYDEYFEAADAYNQKLADTEGAFYDPDLVDGYEDTLDVTGTGIMGYISIDKIKVELPIYHGTSDGVLQVAAGHLEGTSLPVGGSGTHCVISAHRGLPSATLFTHLDALEVGDTFEITVLNRTMTYQVDLISIVLPEEVDKLQIEDGKDYVTLLTCTPYGINTHRLLVRGHRISTNTGSKHIKVTAEAFKVSAYLVSIVLSIPMLAIALVVLLIYSHKKVQTEQEVAKEYLDKHMYHIDDEEEDDAFDAELMEILSRHVEAEDPEEPEEKEVPVPEEEPAEAEIPAAEEKKPAPVHAKYRERRRYKGNQKRNLMRRMRRGGRMR